jgi:hypothetical protein
MFASLMGGGAKAISTIPGTQGCWGYSEAASDCGDGKEFFLA